MIKPLVFCLALGAMAIPTLAEAQSTGGGGGRHGGGGGGGGGGAPSGGISNRSSTPVAPPDKPTNKIEIIGIVTGIDPTAGRVTIAYEAVDALGWPHGSMPFVVSKPDLLKGVTVGEKVRFKLESQQISELKPF
jgi:Cu/Ag efflux protein CusF